MKSKILRFMTASLWLAACAAMPASAVGSGTSRTDPCRGTCDITVTVTATATSCSITGISIDGLHVGADPNPTVIKWTLTGPAGYKFASQDAIKFDKKPQAPPSSIMVNGQGGGSSVTVRDTHKGPDTSGRWRYSIYVTNGTISCKFDPWVDNN